LRGERGDLRGERGERGDLLVVARTLLGCSRAGFMCDMLLLAVRGVNVGDLNGVIVGDLLGFARTCLGVLPLTCPLLLISLSNLWHWLEPAEESVRGVLQPASIPLISRPESAALCNSRSLCLFT
jgi:hypothetical protein